MSAPAVSQVSLLFLLSLSFAAGLAGCKSSAKTSAPPAASPVPPSRVEAPASSGSFPANLVKNVDSPPPPPPVPAAAFQVNPPASFTTEQLPKEGPVEFTVAGGAGQFLLVHVNLNNPTVTA